MVALATPKLMLDVIPNDVTNIKEELIDGGFDATNIVQQEMRVAIEEMLDTFEEEPMFGKRIIPATKTDICIAYEGNQSYKSILISHVV